MCYKSASSCVLEWEPTNQLILMNNVDVASNVYLSTNLNCCGRGGWSSSHGVVTMQLNETWKAFEVVYEDDLEFIL